MLVGYAFNQSINYPESLKTFGWILLEVIERYWTFMPVKRYGGGNKRLKENYHERNYRCSDKRLSITSRFQNRRSQGNYLSEKYSLGIGNLVSLGLTKT